MSKKQTKLNLPAVLAHCRGRFIMLVAAVVISAAAGPARAGYSQMARLTASDIAAGDQFGGSVAISGTTAIVGAQSNDAAGLNSGSAYLFDVSDLNNPVQIAKLTATDAATEDNFGVSVALGGATALVGAWGNDDVCCESGSAYLYDFSDPNNIIETKLTASDADAGDLFGSSVAISGTTAIVGALYDNNACPGDINYNSGSAYLFDVATGIQIAKLTASDAEAFDLFGVSVALGGTTAIVGAWRDDDAGSQSGSAYLYDFSNPNNITEIKLTASDAAAGDGFGLSVAISGATALVGAWGNDAAGSDSGSAYLYDFSDPCNIIETKLTASDAAFNDRFGSSVAISGATALVGALDNGDAGSNSGSAYLFDVATGIQIAKLTASDPEAGDQFGVSAALSGATALVGAWFDGDAGFNSGSAYLFKVCPTADLNDDCFVDLVDFVTFVGQWLQGE